MIDKKKQLNYDVSNTVHNSVLSCQISIIDLFHHSVCIVVLVSNSPLVTASQEAVQDEYKQTDAYSNPI